MKFKKFAAITASALCFTFAFAVTSAIAETNVVFNLGEASKSIDPQLVTGITGSQVDVACMEGLTDIKAGGKIVPAGAASWDISKDGLIYTFHLRKDAKWSNGEPVTADDFFFGMKRALEPATASQYSYFLYNVKNAEAFNVGKIKDFKDVGIKVIDKYTLQITLANPCTYFLQLLSAPTTFPCNEAFFKKVGSSYSLSPDKMLYNGPWQLKSMVTGDGGNYTFTKNPYYWDAKNIKIDNLKFDLITDPNTVALMFMTGQLDLATITANQLNQFSGSKEVFYFPAGGIWYLELNVTNKYLKNENIRKAISLAINRDQLCTDVLKDHSTPALAFVPPGTKGPDGKTFREANGNYNIKENLTEAKELYAKGLKELGVTGPITLKLLVNQAGENVPICVYVQQQLLQNLGINVQLDVETFQSRLLKMQQHNFDMCYAGWIPDYNDPLTYLNLFVTGGGNNDPQFSNKEYDSLISTATNSSDDTVRMADMHKAENILMAQMPIVPLFYPSTIYLKKTWLKGVEFTQITPAVNFRWAYVDK